jgi:hypothetical protein
MGTTMGLLASFSGRYYHLRNKNNQAKFLDQVENKAKLENDGD